jgi:hypothetical protein
MVGQHGGGEGGLEDREIIVVSDVYDFSPTHTLLHSWNCFLFSTGEDMRTEFDLNNTYLKLLIKMPGAG